MNIIDYLSLVMGLLGVFFLIATALAIPAGMFNGWASLAWAAASAMAVIWALNTLGVIA